MAEMDDDATDTTEVHHFPGARGGLRPVARGSATDGDRRPDAVSGWSHWLVSQAGRLLAGGVDLVFPPRCPICRGEPAPRQLERTASGPGGAPGPAWVAQACVRCERELATDVPRCPVCGRPAGTVENCGHCRRRSSPWRQIVVLSAYEGAMREAVLRAKRPSGEDVAASLATLLVRKHRTRLETWGIDRIVPVPMHWLRRSLRGTSAADELAARVAASLRRPWCRALVRRKATPMQNVLPPADRAANVRGVFACRRSVAGARILLVDDVLTTGATLSDCCRALREAGAASVDVAVVACADGAGHDAE